MRSSTKNQDAPESVHTNSLVVQLRHSRDIERVNGDGYVTNGCELLVSYTVTRLL